MFDNFDYIDYIRDCMRTVKVVICQPIGNYFFILCFNMFVLLMGDFVFLKLLMSIITTVIKPVTVFLVKKYSDRFSYYNLFFKK